MISFVNLHAVARTDAGLERAAAIAGCELAVLRAVIRVEAGSHGFDSRGRLTALFEPHIFYRLLAAKRPDALATAQAAGLAYPSWGARAYPVDSYPRIEAACQIDEELALQSASWGLPQILGQNYKAAGYPSASAMVSAFLKSEDDQLLAMARFIKSQGLSDALRRKDWASFARGYNGAGYRKNAYDDKLAAAYAKELAMPARPKKVSPATKAGAGAIVAGTAAAAGAHQWIGGAVGTTVAIIALGFVLLLLLGWLASLKKPVPAIAPTADPVPSPSPHLAPPPSIPEPVAASQLDQALGALEAAGKAWDEAIKQAALARAEEKARADAILANVKKSEDREAAIKAIPEPAPDVSGAVEITVSLGAPADATKPGAAA